MTTIHPAGFKPLLAEKADLEAARFPVLASPKIDGIRALTGILPVICSRNLKPIPNRHIQSIMAGLQPHLDGELLTYTNGVRDDFNTVQSKVMSADGAPDARFHVFDCFKAWDAHFSKRLDAAAIFAISAEAAGHPVAFVTHRLISDAAELVAFERQCVDVEGWEGVMLRDPAGRYKFGRSTAREGILLKVKRFEDAEAVITGTVERMHNGNEAERDALGRSKRSSAKAGLVPCGTLGALQATYSGVAFEIGTGMDDATRADLWARRDALPGQLVTFKFQGLGSKGAPRFPVFVGIRNDL